MTATCLIALTIFAQAGEPRRMDEYRGGGAIAFSPDGSRLLSHGFEGLHVWDVASGREVRLEKSTSFARASADRQAAFSADGRNVVLFESERLITWNAETGARIRSSPGPKGLLACSLVSPDGATLVSFSSSAPGVISLHSFAGEEPRTFAVPEGEVRSIAFSSKGDRVAVSGATQGRQRSAWVRVWESSSGKELLSSPIDPPAGARAVLVRTPVGAFSFDGRLLAVVRTPGAPIPGKPGGPPSIQIWDVESRMPCGDLDGHKDALWETAFSRDGTKLATCGPSEVIVWNLESKKPIYNRPAVAHAVAFTPDGSAIAFIASASEEKYKERTVTVVDLATLKDRFTLPVAYHHDAAFAPDGKALAVSSDQRLGLFDPISGQDLKGGAIGEEAGVVKILKEKGATVRESGGAVTALEAGDCSAWTDDDFLKLGKLSRLRSLSVGRGIVDHSLDLISALPELEVLQTNEARITDGGVQALAKMKKLKTLKFFHPGKDFSGKGLASLAESPALESLTVAGSLAFGDEGMAAACKLVRLKELRTWHAGQTIEGVRCLRDLKNLKSLTLGQRLAYKPPTTLSDETFAVLVGLKSLETLRLEEARLKVDSLIQLKELPALRTLTLEGIDIPEEEVERVRKELPNAKIQWTRPNETYMKRIRALFD